MNQKEFDAEINSVYKLMSDGKTKNIVIDPNDRPTHIQYDYFNGPIKKLIWTNKENKYHRINKPAIIEYSGCKIIEIEYYKDGVLDRKNKPALLCVTIGLDDWCQWWEKGLLIKEEVIESK